MIGMTLITVFMCTNFAACSNDDEIEAEKEAIPLSFKNGDEIYFDNDWSSDKYASYGFSIFLPRSGNTCQWVGYYELLNPDGTINENYTSATYSYEIISENKATLKSVNKQAMSGRTWTVDIAMTFESYNKGTYTSTETNLNTGASHSLRGTFEYFKDKWN